MADDPTPILGLKEGLVATVGAMGSAAIMAFRNRVTLATVVQRLDDNDKVNDELKARQDKMSADVSDMRGDIKVILAKLERN